jgi:translation initiation factor eIF-2B subunit alpha
MADAFKIQLNLDPKGSISTSSSTFSELPFLNLISNFKENLSEQVLGSGSDKLDNQGDIVNAYIRAISIFIEQSQETTLQGLNITIKKATEFLFRKIKEEEIIPKGKSTLSLISVSEIMINMINKHISKRLGEDFTTLKKNLVTITKDLHLVSSLAKEKISKFFNWSMKNGITILIHGYSSTMMECFLQSKKKGINFRVLVTESRPENSGEIMVKQLVENGIDAELILDIAIGYYMKDIDCAVVGAEAVCENGGIINRIGTYTMAICAKNFKKPFYVLVESLKFLKMYPLDQTDIPQTFNTYIGNDKKEYSYSFCDYTPPEFITLLFTDIGIFTPSAVSDELIQMFYN